MDQKKEGTNNVRTSDLVGTATNSSTQFERSAYTAAEDPKIRRQLNNIINKSLSPDIELGCEVADEWNKAQNDLNEAFDKYSRKLAEDTGKAWDGDGTEEHYELQQKYPEYNKIAKKEQQLLKDLVDNANSLAKSKEFSDVKGFEKTMYYYDSYPDHGDWYKKGDQRAYVIAQALVNRNGKLTDMSEIFPDYFVNSYESNGTKLKSEYLDT